MAIKPFKSIQFPGLPDTYTIPQIDSSLNTEGMAADAKAVGDAISQLSADLDNLTTVNEGINFTISVDSNGNATLTRSDLVVTEEEDY